MGSLVADILKSIGKLEKDDLILKVNDLKEKLETMKSGVLESAKNDHSQLKPVSSNIEKFKCSYDSLATEYENLEVQIEKEIKPVMANSVTELSDAMKDLKRIQHLKTHILNLIALREHLKSAKYSLSLASYLKTVEHMQSFKNALENPSAEICSMDKNEIKILSTLETECRILEESLTFSLESAWRENVSIVYNADSKKKKIIINLLKSGNENEIILALYGLKQLRPLLKEFGKDFLNLVCEPVLSSSVKISESKETSLVITIKQENNSPTPTEAFETLKTIFTFLFDAYFQTRVDDHTLMCEFSQVIQDDFCRLVVEKCLKPSVPKHSHQLEGFQKEVMSIQNFCNFLKDLVFLTPNDNPFEDFLQEIDVSPINQITLGYFSRAQKIIQKSISQTMFIGKESSPSSNSSKDVNLNGIASSQSGLSSKSFDFPYCQISVSMDELRKLLVEIKDESKTIASKHMAKLFCTTRDIIELYLDTVLIHHREVVEKFPQQTAIFHNNCMYLAHYLCKLGLVFESEFKFFPREDVPNPTTYVDQVPLLRKLGTEAFTRQMREQKQQLLELLQTHEAFSTVMIEHSSVSQADKAVRQCLCQLQFLQKAWSDILPVEVYFKSAGCLLNAVLEEIVLRIVSMEDIAADASAQMDLVFSLILKQGPDLFKVRSTDNRDSVHRYVKKWFQFQELHLILSASLREIVDRWSVGKGPLSDHFSADQVKHLVRALFQNTERRAAALAKIR